MAMIPVSARAALELPVDELAPHILADLVKPSSSNTNSGEYNYTLQYRSDTQYGYQDNKPAQEAIAEAMGWLGARGMIAYPPAVDPHYNPLFITRRGP